MTPSKKPFRQRGAFVYLAILLLLVVVATALRFLLSAAESDRYATLVHGQSLQAFMAADSGAEIALATLRHTGPMACNVASIPAGDIDAGSTAGFGISAATQHDALPVSAACNGLLSGKGCRVQLQGHAGAAARTVNLDIAYCTPTDAGVTGFGGYTSSIAQKINPYLPNSVVVSNLAFRRKLDSGGPNASSTTCNQTGIYTGSCTQGWNIESSSGLNSVGGRGVIATTTTVGDYVINQRLEADRNYVAVGAIFEGTGVTYLGAYADDHSASNKGTTGTSNIVMGQVTDGRVAGTSATGSAGWCNGADTLVFGFSAKAANHSDTLTAVYFGAANTPLTLLERYTSQAVDMYAEIWYATKPNAAGGIDSLFSSGTPTDFHITKSGTTTDQWAAGFACLKNVDPSTPRGLVSFMQPNNWWEPY